MVSATGIGSLPGTDLAEAVKIVFDELPELPHLPELPSRGATASMIGRTLALLPLDADLQPAGWRLTGTAGAPAADQRRATSQLGQDLDTLEELTDGYQGPFKIQVAGPWTLAATVERPRGDKLLADYGARRELAQALAEGLAEHLKDVRRRVSATRLVVQLDEPALATVLAGRVPTASGFGSHRFVHLPEVSEALSWVIDAAGDAEVWIHSCAPDTPLGLLRGAGAAGVSVDLSMLKATDHDDLGEILETGGTVALGVVPTTGVLPGDKEITERVLRWLDMLGLDPAQVGEQLVLTPACGLAGASAAHAKAALALVRTSAASLK